MREPDHRQDYLSSDGVTKHWVSVYIDGDSRNPAVISCSCRGFSTPNKCWHVKAEAKKLGRVLDTNTWGATLGPEFPQLCEETVGMIGSQYLRCGAPAVMLVKHRRRNEDPYLMCLECGEHNAHNRNAEVLARFK